MKKIARLIGVIGGVAAVVWAMRDRLVSITAPREPEPPRFRVVTPPSEPPMAPTDDDLTEVVGIGPVFAERLRAAGVQSFEELANTAAARLAEITGVPESRVEAWIAQAGALASS